MKIRPHHLLCTRSFRGRGYSDVFIDNMRKVINQLRKNADVELYSGMDCICSACPENNRGICSSQGKITMLDRETVKYLKLDKQNYSYSGIEKIIAEQLSEDVYNTICGDCEWKKKGICTYADVCTPL
jgi:uncharacterized protein